METPPPNPPGLPLPSLDWPSRLRADDALTPGQREAYRLTISRFLSSCQGRSTPVTVAAARQFVELARLELAPGPSRVREWKEALNWYFRQARKPLVISGLPSLGQTDLGQTPWEQALIAGIRERHLAWRTEQSYRGWMWRFIRFLGNRALAEVGAADVRNFLSHLAVQERLGAAAQKQALHPVR